MSQSSKTRVIVVGGGLAGLAATVRIAEAGIDVQLFSIVPVKRSHSVCAQGGINACNELARQQGYSEWMHMDETLYGGDFLNHQPPVYEMTHYAPRIIDLLDRMGVPFNRTSERHRDLRLFGGSLYKRTHFAGASTGQQILYALDEQTRRYEAMGKVQKFEFWDFLWPMIDDSGPFTSGFQGVCKGIVAQNIRNMEIRSFPADAVVIATGGCGLIFGKSTNSVICNGAAASRCYQAGVWLGNPEFIQVHPTAIPGKDKCRLMSESARGEGGRVWVPQDKNDTRHPVDIPESERDYFLEEKYPKYGNLVPRDIATREIFFKCQAGFGVGGGKMVYMDITHLPDQTKTKLKAILEMYEKFTGDDPTKVPMKIFPAVHYTMGGLYTHYSPKPNQHGLEFGSPYNMMSNMTGLYAFGEVNCQYHGATRLGANALLSCLFDGLFCGMSVVNYVNECVDRHMDASPASLFDRYVNQETQKMQNLLNHDGQYNPYEIHRIFGDELTESCTVVREEIRMLQTYDTLNKIKDQYAQVKLTDTGTWTNQSYFFTKALGDMIKYGEVILAAALKRKESRGSHYRSDYPKRSDSQYHNTTIAKYDAANDQPVLEYEPVSCLLVPPRERTYGSKVENLKVE